MKFKTVHIHKITRNAFGNFGHELLQFLKG